MARLSQVAAAAFYGGVSAIIGMAAGLTLILGARDLGGPLSIAMGAVVAATALIAVATARSFKQEGAL